MSWKTRYEGSDEFGFFTELTKIPRPSGHLDKIREYLISFAEKHGLRYETDGAGNLLIRREGTSGKTVVLQGHMDIVATAAPGTRFDFENQPLDTYVEHGWIHARNTTLGADDGGGLALMMCALTDPGLGFADLECLFTADEEIGLVGAAGLRRDWLKGKYLINLDSEDINEITIGSAGSTDVEAFFGYSADDSYDPGYLLEISGLAGGHSAMEIDRKRGNAILILAGFLNKLKGVRISEFAGGSASNVIPMSSHAKFTVPAGTDVDGAFEKYAEECLELMEEPAFLMSVVKADAGKCWSESDTSSFLNALLTCPNGVSDYDSFGIKTSSNIGVADNGRVVIKPRSSDASALNALVGRISRIFSEAGAEVPVPEIFPAWKESEDSILVVTATEVYRGVFGHGPTVTVTHGGLESSTVKERNRSVEGAIAIGPTILGAHTPDERMDLRTLTEAKEYLFELLKTLTGQ